MIFRPERAQRMVVASLIALAISMGIWARAHHDDSFGYWYAVVIAVIAMLNGMKFVWANVGTTILFTFLAVIIPVQLADMGPGPPFEQKLLVVGIYEAVLFSFIFLLKRSRLALKQ